MSEPTADCPAGYWDPNMGPCVCRGRVHKVVLWCAEHDDPLYDVGNPGDPDLECASCWLHDTDCRLEEPARHIVIEGG